MKNWFLIGASLALFAACSSDTHSSGENLINTSDSMPQDSLPASIIAGGKKASYPFPPDSCFNKFVLGNLDSLQTLADKFGRAEFEKQAGGISLLRFRNNHDEQMLTVYMHHGTKEGPWGNPYSLVLEPFDSLTKYETEPKRTRDLNFVSAYGIFIGMPKDRLLAIYKGQEFGQKMQDSTLTLTYLAEAQDSIYYKRYAWNTYRAEFQFKDDLLKRVEFTFTPKDSK
ncbi:MAG: hypothetical protein ACRCYO_17750 [Bacteroidia bacterium]